MDRCSDWLNPILVKESRQAMKSRQFVTTFSLLLIASWVWSMLGVAILSPGVYYVPGGRFMLVGYFLIQNFPLVIIIPFAAFRSLAAEREDGTYELLSISTLQPRQIILGKLGSASLQILIYLSVLAPCMAFTYLLRGVDILLVLSLVCYSALGCWLLCCLGLLLATLTKARHWQILISVFFILLLGFLCFVSSISVSAMIVESRPIPFELPEYWIAQAMILTVIFAAATMFVLAATARITSRSENRSTPLRIGMLVCHLLLVGWCSRYLFKFGEEFILAIYVCIATVGWALMGGLMVGEDTLLSPRVRRGLPQTTMGRLLLTLFYPGPGTGYLFALANMAVVTVVAMTLAVARYGWPWPRDIQQIVSVAWIGGAYVTFYVGLGLALSRVFSRHSLIGPMTSLIVSWAMVVLGALFPLIVQFSLRQYLVNGDDYTLIQLPNAFWTILEVGDDVDQVWLGLLVALMACPVFVYNLVRLRVQNLTPMLALVPPRVEDDDQDQLPRDNPSSRPSSPWDEAFPGQ